MRGVVSVGMAAAFETRGLLHVFDSIHGSSAGACGGAYFLAGQAAFGATIYYEDINNRRFIDLSRPLRGRAIMNKDYLVDDVMHIRKPLAVSKICQADKMLHVVTTEVEGGQAKIFSSFANAAHFFEVIRATICLPVIAGRPVTVDGVSLVDGGLAQQIAVRSAIDAGATHVIVLMTRRANELWRTGSDLMNKFEAFVLKTVFGSHLSTRYLVRAGEINAVLADVQRGATKEGVIVEAIVRPPEATALGRLTTDGTRLYQARLEAEATASRYIDG